MKGIPWKHEEEAALKIVYPDPEKSREWLCETFNRSWNAIFNKAKRLGLTREEKWISEKSVIMDILKNNKILNIYDEE